MPNRVTTSSPSRSARRNSTEPINCEGIGFKAVTYGPGTSAKVVYGEIEEYGALQFGTVLPGKMQTQRVTYVIPADQVGDVTVEVRPGWDIFRGSAVFTGSIV
jgi:hypothetical protein